MIFARFPNSRTLRRRWLDAFTPSCKVTIDSVVCSQHFLEDQYETIRGKKRLKAKVIPTIFSSQNKPSNNDTIPKKENEDTPAKTNEKSSDTENTAAPDDSLTPENSSNDTENNATPNDSHIPPDHRDEENKMATNTIDNEENKMATNTIDNENKDNIVRTVPSTTTMESYLIDDIENIITNYLIKQTRPLNTETHETQEDQMDKQINGEMEIRENRQMGNGETGEMETINVDELKDPVYIEVSVDKAGSKDPIDQDCLMLLESVQCDVDPSSLVFQEPETDNSSDVIDLGEKKEDPISLLTSSDEDEVIIEEPEIDTVEVSDETDEDDVPLVKLFDKSLTKSKKTKSKKSTKSKKKSHSEDVTKIMWNVYDYICVQCDFKSNSKSEYKRHLSEHLTVLQICQMCSYTTASKSQFAKHKRKHQEEKKFKCHLCDYKARHNMSLIYHLKSHENDKSGKTKHFKHKRHKGPKVHQCRYCNYATTRLCDMKRHVIRRHTKA
ncbi:unnamed protein product [Euphydryas editha]|uniref:Uncharacterized protein n=1 Tax=Euphydryas editha TaxID=104508 RepID=A0AAU9UPQ6_EUPED|nr:unnamed protein product [Euphydryas editha]